MDNPERLSKAPFLNTHMSPRKVWSLQGQECRGGWAELGHVEWARLTLEGVQVGTGWAPEIVGSGDYSSH